MKIRYEKSTGKSRWIDCIDADVKEGALVIQETENSVTWVPLHVIRGMIQLRADDVWDPEEKIG